ncbi:peptidase C69 [Trueperella pyogenes]|uniref:C69 family dipeptidase n=1 Tax=Trueperella pyogenes TaxID=1661 RepID=UPI00043ACB27|nr:C69 family dipeptidase [Trueperella pyogenes]AHU89227.1 peptidase C69 [Trueperella pyogenes]OQD38628.1 dipeptidase [Trueperella pyogenes]
MGCTTILVGKKASNDGSTMIARTDDSGSGNFEAKRFVVVKPEDQPRLYTSTQSRVTVVLPDNPMAYTCMPDAVQHKGVWPNAGINAAGIAMSATETLTSNERVLAADPLVVAEGDTPGGIGEEDLVLLVLPYIRSAREGVRRLGALLEEYGTYEMNGIAFADADEIWWLETVGGHHWMARRVPDECYAVIPNQLGLDALDFADAFGDQRDFMCSADMREFISENNLDLTLGTAFNPRLAFGSHSDSDHTYNTPRAWGLQRYFNPRTSAWDGPNADYTPMSDDIPWCRVPEHKIPMEEVKYALAYHYQGTEFDPYARHGLNRGKFRPIGINRTTSVGGLNVRPGLEPLHWVAFGSMPFNAMVPFYPRVSTTPSYLADTSGRVTTEAHYWHNRIIAALVDAHFHECSAHVARYQLAVGTQARALIQATDTKLTGLGMDGTCEVSAEARTLMEETNQKIADMLQRETDDLLDKVLFDASMKMRNAFSSDDA